MTLDPPDAPALSGAEPLIGVGATVLDFWRFAMGDLRTNNVRGHLAEFLVAKAVGAEGMRVEWAPWDVTAPDGTTIEVKSSAYLQSWRQTSLSAPSFKVSATYAWDEDSRAWSAQQGFNADVYVFALQTAQTHRDYDPTDASQWVFYVAPRRLVETRRGAAMGVVALQRLAGAPVTFEELALAIDAAARGAASAVETGPRVTVAASVRPRMHRDEQFLALKRARLWETHVAPINELVDEIRTERGEFVPYVDPDSGGVGARILFVLESPAAPAARGSGMLSPDNDDGTATNMWNAYSASGLSRQAALHWNAVPWFVGDGRRERNVTDAQVRQGHVYLERLLELATDVQVVVAMGRPAQASLQRLETTLAARGIELVECLHPSPRNNSRDGRAKVLEVFEHLQARLRTSDS